MTTIGCAGGAELRISPSQSFFPAAESHDPADDVSRNCHGPREPRRSRGDSHGPTTLARVPAPTGSELARHRSTVHKAQPIARAIHREASTLEPARRRSARIAPLAAVRCNRATCRNQAPSGGSSTTGIRAPATTPAGRRRARSRPGRESVPRSATITRRVRSGRGFGPIRARHHAIRSPSAVHKSPRITRQSRPTATQATRRIE